MEKSIDGVKSLKRQNLAAARVSYGEACRLSPVALRFLFPYSPTPHSPFPTPSPAASE